MEITSVSAAAQQSQVQAAAAAREKAAAASDSADSSEKTLYEMMKDAQEKIDAHKDSLKTMKPRVQYSDAPIMAYSRLSRAKTHAQVNAAAGYARQQIARLRAAKYTDSDNAKQIQAAINQLQKAVSRAGKKNKDIDREKLSETRQKKMIQQKRTRAAQRERQELRRKKAARMIRESGYIREAEIDKRMQSYMSATQAELRNQAQALSAAIQPSADAVAQEYAAASAEIPAAALDVQAWEEFSPPWNQRFQGGIFWAVCIGLLRLFANILAGVIFGRLLCEHFMWSYSEVLLQLYATLFDGKIFLAEDALPIFVLHPLWTDEKIRPFWWLKHWRFHEAPIETENESWYD